MDIVIKELKKYYGDRLVLDLDYLRLPAQTINAIVGPNGCGKTTLLNIIGGLDRGFKGRVLYGGKEDTIARVRQDITLVMQKPYIFNDTVFNNAALGLKFRAVKGKELKERVVGALEMVGLEGYHDRKAVTLSGGEMQRLSFARAIAFSPKIMLLDEPTANIDRENKVIISGIIKEMKNKGTNIILVSHDSTEIDDLADNIIKLSKIQP